VTGFGLLGHASHIARASHVTLQIHAASVPILPGTIEALGLGASSDGLRRNQEYVEPMVSWTDQAPEVKAVLCDPQTSGGLLVCVPHGHVAQYLSKVEGAVEIGEVVERKESAIEIN
jgi:selenide,water dikinase